MELNELYTLRENIKNDVFGFLRVVTPLRIDGEIYKNDHSAEMDAKGEEYRTKYMDEYTNGLELLKKVSAVITEKIILLNSLS